MFHLPLKSSSEALLKSSSGAFPFLSVLGLAFRVTQASVAVIRSGYLATQAVQKAVPLSRALLPTPTMPLVVSKTLPAVGNAESTRLSMVAGFLVLGISMGTVAFLGVRRRGSSGRFSGNSTPGQGLPTRFPGEDLSARAPSSAGAPPPPPPDLETETVPEPRGKPWILWIMLLALVVSLIVIVIARRLWYEQVKPYINQCAEGIQIWLSEWTCVAIMSVLSIGSVEVLLWVAWKIKSFCYCWVVTMESFRLWAKTKVKLAAFVISIIAQIIIIGALCHRFRSIDWLYVTRHVLGCLARNPHMRPYMIAIYRIAIMTYVIGRYCFDSLTPARTIVLIAPAVIIRLFLYMRNLKSQMDAALPGQLAELQRNNKDFDAQLSAIALIESDDHVSDMPVSEHSGRLK